MNYKTPVSSIVENQFPEFVKDNYQLFIDFLKFYYKFLNEDQIAGIGPDFDKIRDVDETLSKFIVNFGKKLGWMFLGLI